MRKRWYHLGLKDRGFRNLVPEFDLTLADQTQNDQASRRGGKIKDAILSILKTQGPTNRQAIKHTIREDNQIGPTAIYTALRRLCHKGTIYCVDGQWHLKAQRREQDP